MQTVESTDSKARILDRVGSVWLQACSHYGLDSRLMPDVDFSLRGRAAGQAQLRLDHRQAGGNGPRLRLRFNLEAFALDPEEFLCHTIPHEIAHLITWRRFGKEVAPHGQEWREIMTSCFGLPAHRTHTLALQPARRILPRFQYRCQCGEHLLTAVRHHKVIRYRARYICRHCGHALRFIREQTGGAASMVRPGTGDPKAPSQHQGLGES